MKTLKTTETIAATTCIVICAVIFAAVYPITARASTPYVYCESAFGSVSVHKGRCPYGTKFIGVKG